VTEFADDAFRNRADRQQRAQFRLQYRLSTDGDGLNDLTTYLSGNHLTVDERPHLLLS